MRPLVSVFAPALVPAVLKIGGAVLAAAIASPYAAVAIVVLVAIILIVAAWMFRSQIGAFFKKNVRSLATVVATDLAPLLPEAIRPLVEKLAEAVIEADAFFEENMANAEFTLSTGWIWFGICALFFFALAVVFEEQLLLLILSA